MTSPVKTAQIAISGGIHKSSPLPNWNEDSHVISSGLAAFQHLTSQTAFYPLTRRVNLPHGYTVSQIIFDQKVNLNILSQPRWLASAQ